MAEEKIDRKAIVDKILFLVIGAVLFFLLFDFTEDIAYSDPIVIVKLFGIAVYLLVGEKIVKLLASSLFNV